MRKRILAILLSLSLILMYVPQMVFAEGIDAVTLNIANGSIVITETGYSVGGTEEISYTGDYIITGTSSTNNITVASGTHTITLQDVTIDVSSVDLSAIELEGNANVSLVLSGSNYLKSADNHAGIRAENRTDNLDDTENTATLTISGTGSLEVYGGSQCAGIGGNNGWQQTVGGHGGIITINSGTVKTTGGNYGAGIGGGSGGSGGNRIVINGGTVNAYGAHDSAAIGGGSNFDGLFEGGTVTINGGIIYATGGIYATGIGGGSGGTADVIINGGIITANSVDTGNQSSWNGIVNGTVYGTVTLTEDYTVPADSTLTIPDGQTLIIGEGVTFTNDGTVTLENGGTIVANGTFKNNGIMNCAHSNATGATCLTPVACEYCSADIYDSLNHEQNADTDGIYNCCGSIESAVWNENDLVYEISNVGQLYWFAGLVNGTLTDGTAKNRSANAKLMANLDLDGYDWFPIGQYSDNWDAIGTENKNSEYAGTFDGNYHTISNLTVSQNLPYECGLFGRISGGTIKNLGVINASITNTATLDGKGVRVGVIAGECHNSTISNCYTAGTIVLTNNDGGQRGGIAGESSGGTIINSYTVYEKLTELGTINNSYCSADIKTEAYTSGELCWMLNGKTTDDTNVWRQTIDEDAYPVFDGDLVYAAETVLGNGIRFTNDEAAADEYHLVDASPSHTQVANDELTLSADVQNNNGKSTDETVTYQWYNKNSVLTTAPTGMDDYGRGNWVEGDTKWTYTVSSDYSLSYRWFNFTVAEGGAIGFEYKIPNSEQYKLWYSLSGSSSSHGSILGNDAQGEWQQLVFENLPAGDYRLMLEIFCMGSAPYETSYFKLQTACIDYVAIDGATAKNYTVPASDAVTAGINTYKVAATCGDASEEIEIEVNVAAPSYTVTIPATATPGEAFTVSADATLLRSVDELTVRVTGTSGTDNAFTLTNAQNVELGYTLKNGDNVIGLNDKLLALTNGQTGSVSIDIVPDKAKYSGDYTGTVIFTIALEEVVSE